jgi:hypothetical protein
MHVDKVNLGEGGPTRQRTSRRQGGIKEAGMHTKEAEITKEEGEHQGGRGARRQGAKGKKLPQILSVEGSGSMVCSVGVAGLARFGSQK